MKRRTKEFLVGVFSGVVWMVTFMMVALTGVFGPLFAPMSLPAAAVIGVSITASLIIWDATVTRYLEDLVLSEESRKS